MATGNRVCRRVVSDHENRFERIAFCGPDQFAFQHFELLLRGDISGIFRKGDKIISGDQGMKWIHRFLSESTAEFFIDRKCISPG